MTPEAAKRLADRYITSDGAKPEPIEEKDLPSDIQDVMTLATFLAHVPNGDWYGGVMARDAWEAYARLLKTTPEELFETIRGGEL